MSRRAKGFAFTALAVAMLCVIYSQSRMDSIRAKASDEELLYLPNEHLLIHLTAGMNSVVADLLWLKCIQYTSREFHSKERKFAWLDHICETAVRLDPYFSGAYEIGATLLGAIGNDTAAMQLLNKGLTSRPDRWELPFEAAKIHILNRREEPGAAEAASYYLAWTSDLAPDELTRARYAQWAVSVQVKGNLTDSGRQIWKTILDTTQDKMMRELAARKLVELDIHDNREILRKAAEAFTERHGAKPSGIEDLIAPEMAEGIAQDALGGRFFVDDNGNVQNTTLLDAVMEERLRSLRRAISMHKEKKGAFPSDLEDLVAEGILKQMLTHPYAGRSWSYESATGEIK